MFWGTLAHFLDKYSLSVFCVYTDAGDSSCDLHRVGGPKIGPAHNEQQEAQLLLGDRETRKHAKDC